MTGVSVVLPSKWLGFVCGCWSSVHQVASYLESNKETFPFWSWSRHGYHVGYGVTENGLVYHMRVMDPFSLDTENHTLACRYFRKWEGIDVFAVTLTCNGGQFSSDGWLWELRVFTDSSSLRGENRVHTATSRWTQWPCRYEYFTILGSNHREERPKSSSYSPYSRHVPLPPTHGWKYETGSLPRLDVATVHVPL